MKPKQVQSEALYSVAQAAVICAVEPKELQQDIDRDCLSYTALPHGARNQRMFSLEQLIWLYVFYLLKAAGYPPKLARAYTIACPQFLKSIDHTRGPIEYLVFPLQEDKEEFVRLKGQAVPVNFHFVRRGEDLKNAVGPGALVLGYAAITETVKRETRGISFVNRYIELHPEKFNGE